MPELPDVEVFRQYFQATSLHQAIERIEVPAPEILADTSPQALGRLLAGREFAEASRHGKYLFGHVPEAGWLVLHFGMTGFLKYYRDQEEQAPGHIRLQVRFANGYRLAYDCGRKIGRVGWTDDRQAFIEDKELGPDPFADDFDREAFLDLLDSRRGTIKGLLMNQQALAGIGNVYADEILFQAGIDPQRPLADLSADEQRNLYECMHRVLRAAIDCRVGADGWPDGWLLPKREPGAACPRCSGEIEKRRVSGRSTYVCAGHQR